MFPHSVPRRPLHKGLKTCIAPTKRPVETHGLSTRHTETWSIKIESDAKSLSKVVEIWLKHENLILTLLCHVLIKTGRWCRSRTSCAIMSFMHGDSNLRALPSDGKFHKSVEHTDSMQSIGENIAGD